MNSFVLVSPLRVAAGGLPGLLALRQRHRDSLKVFLSQSLFNLLKETLLVYLFVFFPADAISGYNQRLPQSTVTQSPSGGEYRIRTDDPLLAKQVL